MSDLIDTATAARLAGVRPATIRQWAARHLIFAEGQDDCGRKLYPAAQVLEAERRTRRARGGRPRKVSAA